MMPTMLDPATIDLGGDLSRFGWTIDGFSVLLVLGAVLFPLVALCCVGIVDAIKSAPALRSMGFRRLLLRPRRGSAPAIRHARA